MPWAPNLAVLLPCVALFHGGGLYSNRLKHLEKSDRREVVSCMGSCGGAVVVDELGRDLSKFVQVEDSEEDGCAPPGDNSESDVHDDDLKLDVPDHVTEWSGKSLVLPPGKVEDGDEAEMEPHKSAPLLQLVSALKGGRENLGVVPRKLSVTWAPEVYDPIPNSSSHTGVKRNKKKYRKDREKDNKKNKKGQKSGKDKKQLRKHGGRSDKGHRTAETVSNFVHVSDDIGDFDVGSPDYCGSSFLRESQTKFHFSVAEAL